MHLLNEVVVVQAVEIDRRRRCGRRGRRHCSFLDRRRLFGCSEKRSLDVGDERGVVSEELDGKTQADEALLLKCYDTAQDGRCPFTAHSAFDLPHVPPGTRPRESIEIRTLAFFDTPVPTSKER